MNVMRAFATRKIITKGKLCGQCVQICPENCIDIDGKERINRELCTVCGKCVDECYAEALNIFGTLMTPEDVLYEIQKDRAFYRENGGVTFSGGEPTSQNAFLLETLKLCKDTGINTAVETCGFFNWSNIEPLLEYLDTILFDLKMIDEKKHIRYCGQSNELILHNATKIVTKFNQIQFRIPLIPGVNDYKENIVDTCNMLKNLNQKSLSIVPYHKLEYEKYQLLNREPRDKKLKPISSNRIKKVQKWIKERGLIPILII